MTGNCASATGDHERSEKLRRLGAHLTRVAHELRAPVSLIAGSLENLDLHFHALLRLAAATKLFARRDPELARVYAETRADYAVANAGALLAICDEGVHRVNYVVEQLGRFARPADAVAPAGIDLEDLLRRAAVIAISARHRSPAIDWAVSGLEPIDGDVQALLQVFVNVIGNAFDAVAERDDGRVRVAAEFASDRAAIEVRVSDNGPGVPPADRDSIFDPFFTTKSAGGGLGLGLAIVRETLARQEGTIDLAVHEAPGAEFLIRLPVTRDRPPATAATRL